MERSIQIDGMSDELLDRLDQRARQIGIDRDSYVRKLIERALAPPSTAQTFRELLAAAHDFTDAHGMSDDELDAFFTEQVADARQDRRKSNERVR